MTDDSRMSRRDLLGTGAAIAGLSLATRRGFAQASGNPGLAAAWSDAFRIGASLGVSVTTLSLSQDLTMRTNTTDSWPRRSIRTGSRAETASSHTLAKRSRASV